MNEGERSIEIQNDIKIQLKLFPSTAKARFQLSGSKELNLKRHKVSSSPSQPEDLINWEAEKVSSLSLQLYFATFALIPYLARRDARGKKSFRSSSTGENGWEREDALLLKYVKCYFLNIYDCTFEQRRRWYLRCFPACYVRAGER